MKMVIAYVQTFMAPGVVDALHAIPALTGATISPVNGFGRGRARGSRVPASEDFVGTRPKVRIEALVPDRLAAEVVAAIERAARTGNPGDGKVCVLPVEHVVRIRTGEEDEQAI